MTDPTMRYEHLTPIAALVLAACSAWPYVEIGGGHSDAGGTYGEARTGVVLTPKPEEAGAGRPSGEPIHDDAAAVWDERNSGAQGEPGPTGLQQGAPQRADANADPVRDPFSELAGAISDLARAISADNAPAGEPNAGPGPADGSAGPPLEMRLSELEAGLADLESNLAALVGILGQRDPAVAQLALQYQADQKSGGTPQLSPGQVAGYAEAVDAWSPQRILTGLMILTFAGLAFVAYKVLDARDWLRPRS